MKDIKLIYLLVLVLLSGACSKTQESFKKSIEELDLEGVKSHIQAKLDVNEPSTTGESLLMIASQKANGAIVKELITAGANLNAVDNNGNNALMYAAKSGKAENISVLLDHKADPYMLNSKGESFLSLSKENNEICDVINQKLVYDDQLITVAGTGTPTQIDSLIELGASANCFRSSHYTPLMNAAYNGNIDNVKKLLEKGANKEFKNLSGETALDYAKSAYNEQLETIGFTYEDIGLNKNNVGSIISDEKKYERKMNELKRNMSKQGSSYQTSILVVGSFTCAVILHKMKGLHAVIKLLEE